MGDIAALASQLVKIAQLKSLGHDFSPALAEKLKGYSIETAVKSTIDGISEIRA
jgi:hypothetical protein